MGHTQGGGLDKRHPNITIKLQVEFIQIGIDGLKARTRGE